MKLANLPKTEHGEALAVWKTTQYQAAEGTGQQAVMEAMSPLHP